LTVVGESNSARKAIVLLSSIPEEDATQLLAQFSDTELQALVEAAGDATSPTELEQDELSRDFATHLQTAWITTPTEEVFEYQSLTSELAVEPEDVVSPEDAIRERFREFADEDPECLRSLLALERPQTVAIVLAFLPPETSATVLRALPTELQIAASVRVAQLDHVDMEAACAVAEVLHQRLVRRHRPLDTEIGGPRHLARILQATDHATERALLENLVHEDRDLVHDIQQHLALIRDLRRLTLPGGRLPVSDTAPTPLGGRITVSDTVGVGDAD
jgi:flagellar motor switch protein FliG